MKVNLTKKSIAAATFGFGLLYTVSVVSAVTQAQTARNGFWWHLTKNRARPAD